MSLRADEIASIIKKELGKYSARLRTESVGTVVQVGDGIARVAGLDDAMVGELIEFPRGLTGMVMNLEEDSVGCVIFGTDNPEGAIREGNTVTRTGKAARIPVGPALLGRVVGAIGRPLDGKGPVLSDRYRPLESRAPNVIERQPVSEPLETGIRAIDAMIPIGRGQRELIIGDRQTGKTAIALDAIINQKGKDVYCVYVAVGQKISSIVAAHQTLKKYGAMEYTTIVCASSRASASLQYLAPYAGCAIGEELMYSGKHVLVVYDDLTRHAQAYRQLSLLLRRPPGREAYPGDVFYLHSRLLERAAKLSDKLGGGSLTAIPILETQAGDITSYIPTNVISITDGQIYLESDLFYSGVRPPVNVGLSVSRVGGKAQTRAMRQVALQLRLDLAQYRELLTFTQFGSELDTATARQLARGERMVELLKQGQYEPQGLSRQVIALFAGTRGFLDDIPAAQVRRFESRLFAYLETDRADLLRAIGEKKELSAELSQGLESAIREFRKGAEREYGGVAQTDKG